MEVDFAALCHLLDVQCPPRVRIQGPALALDLAPAPAPALVLDLAPAPALVLDLAPAPGPAGAEKAGRKDPADGSPNTNAAASWSERCIQVELENEDPLTARSLKIFGEDHGCHRPRLYLGGVV